MDRSLRELNSLLDNLTSKPLDQEGLRTLLKVVSKLSDHIEKSQEQGESTGSLTPQLTKLVGVVSGLIRDNSLLAKIKDNLLGDDPESVIESLNLITTEALSRQLEYSSQEAEKVEEVRNHLRVIKEAEETKRSYRKKLASIRNALLNKNLPPKTRSQKSPPSTTFEEIASPRVLVEAILRSSVPPEEKVDLLLQTAAQLPPPPPPKTPTLAEKMGWKSPLSSVSEPTPISRPSSSSIKSPTLVTNEGLKALAIDIVLNSVVGEGQVTPTPSPKTRYQKPPPSTTSASAQQLSYLLPTLTPSQQTEVFNIFAEHTNLGGGVDGQSLRSQVEVVHQQLVVDIAQGNQISPTTNSETPLGKRISEEIESINNSVSKVKEQFSPTSSTHQTPTTASNQPQPTTSPTTPQPPTSDTFTKPQEVGVDSQIQPTSPTTPIPTPISQPSDIQSETIVYSNQGGQQFTPPNLDATKSRETITTSPLGLLAVLSGTSSDFVELAGVYEQSQKHTPPTTASNQPQPTTSPTTPQPPTSDTFTKPQEVGVDSQIQPTSPTTPTTSETLVTGSNTSTTSDDHQPNPTQPNPLPSTPLSQTSGESIEPIEESGQYVVPQSLGTPTLSQVSESEFPLTPQVVGLGESGGTKTTPSPQPPQTSTTSLSDLKSIYNQTHQEIDFQKHLFESSSTTTTTTLIQSDAPPHTPTNTSNLSFPEITATDRDSVPLETKVPSSPSTIPSTLPPESVTTSPTTPPTTPFSPPNSQDLNFLSTQPSSTPSTQGGEDTTLPTTNLDYFSLHQPETSGLNFETNQFIGALSSEPIKQGELTAFSPAQVISMGILVGASDHQVVELLKAEFPHLNTPPTSIDITEHNELLLATVSNHRQAMIDMVESSFVAYPIDQGVLPEVLLSSQSLSIEQVQSHYSTYSRLGSTMGVDPFALFAAHYNQIITSQQPFLISLSNQVTQIYSQLNQMGQFSYSPGQLNQFQERYFQGGSGVLIGLGGAVTSFGLLPDTSRVGGSLEGSGRDNFPGFGDGIESVLPGIGAGINTALSGIGGATGSLPGFLNPMSLLNNLTSHLLQNAIRSFFSSILSFVGTMIANLIASISWVIPLIVASLAIGTFFLSLADRNRIYIGSYRLSDFESTLTVEWFDLASLNPEQLDIFNNIISAYVLKTPIGEFDGSQINNLTPTSGPDKILLFDNPSEGDVSFDPDNPWFIYRLTLTKKPGVPPARLASIGSSLWRSTNESLEPESVQADPYLFPITPWENFVFTDTQNKLEVVFVGEFRSQGDTTTWFSDALFSTDVNIKLDSDSTEGCSSDTDQNCVVVVSLVDSAYVSIGDAPEPNHSLDSGLPTDAPEALDSTGTCPLTGEVTGLSGSYSYNPSTGQSTGHGGDSYSYREYPIPISSMYLEPNGNSCVSAPTPPYNSVCPYYGYARDVMSQNKAVYVPNICADSCGSCGDSQRWVVRSAWTTCAGGASSSDSCPTPHWGKGIILSSTDGCGNNYRLYLNHLASFSNKSVYNSGDGIGYHCASDTTCSAGHLHIELVVNEIPIKPELVMCN